MLPNDDTCYRAVESRDPRFDGMFFTAVTSTRIYCRPSCPALTPRRDRVRFYPSAAAAQGHGFRACKRCRPDAAPGSADWNVRADVAGRALRLIMDGVLDRDGVPELARRLGYSTRQLQRTLTTEVGAGPLALARAQRAQTARTLLETTDLPAADVAFAAGFASIRQFDDTVREVFADTPSGLRARRHRGGAPTPGELELRLPFRAPLDPAELLRWLGFHAVPGLESFTGGVFSRTLDLPHAPAAVRIGPGGPTWLTAWLRLGDLKDLPAAVARLRRLLDLDADPVATDAALAADPALAELVAARPGLRSPGDVDGFETLIRTVVGQQISLAGARTVLGRVVAAHGRTLPAAMPGEPERLFPTPTDLAAVDPTELPMPRARARAVVGLARHFADGFRLDPGSDRTAAGELLLALPGVGPWTAGYVAMRSLGDPDVLLVGDLAARRVAESIGLDLTATERWSPWRSYVTHHLWALALARRLHPEKEHLL